MNADNSGTGGQDRKSTEESREEPREEPQDQPAPEEGGGAEPGYDPDFEALFPDTDSAEDEDISEEGPFEEDPEDFVPEEDMEEDMEAPFSEEDNSDEMSADDGTEYYEEEDDDEDFFEDDEAYFEEEFEEDETAGSGQTTENPASGGNVPVQKAKAFVTRYFNQLVIGAGILIGLIFLMSGGGSDEAGNNTTSPAPLAQSSGESGQAQAPFAQSQNRQTSQQEDPFANLPGAERQQTKTADNQEPSQGLLQDPSRIQKETQSRQPREVREPTTEKPRPPQSTGSGAESDPESNQRAQTQNAGQKQDSAPVSDERLASLERRLDGFVSRFERMERQLSSLSENMGTLSENLKNIRENPAPASAQPPQDLPENVAPMSAVKELRNMMSQIEGKLDKLDTKIENTGARPSESDGASFGGNTTTTTQKQDSTASSQSGTRPSTDLAPRNAPAPPPKWRLRAAGEGIAWIAHEGSNQLKQIREGETVRGLGRIRTVTRETRGWVVRGTEGTLSQQSPR